NVSDPTVANPIKGAPLLAPVRLGLGMLDATTGKPTAPSFLGIESLTGTNGVPSLTSDLLTGADVINGWSVNGKDQGSVNYNNLFGSTLLFGPYAGAPVRNTALAVTNATT